MTKFNSETMKLEYIYDSELKATLKGLIDNEILLVSDDVIIGNISEITSSEHSSKIDKTKYNMINLKIKGCDGKYYNKRYSVDFFRKLIKQLNIKVEYIENLIGATVLFKVKDKFKNITTPYFLAFDTANNNYHLCSYVDEDNDDAINKLKKLLG